MHRDYEKHKIFVRRPERNRPHARPRHKSEDNIKTHFKEIEWEGVDWIHLALDRDHWWWPLVNTVMYFQVP
jgi:hypothetical protein